MTHFSSSRVLGHCFRNLSLLRRHMDTRCFLREAVELELGICLIMDDN